MIKYFYQTETATVGPVSFHELWTAAKEAKLRPHDSVRVDNLRDWVRAEHVPGLFANQEPPTDEELLRIVHEKRLGQIRVHQSERLSEAEEALRRRNEALQKAGLPPESALPYSVDTDFPGSDYALLKPGMSRSAVQFQPREYPMIELGITLLYVLGVLVILFAIGGMLFSFNQPKTVMLPLLINFVFVCLGGVFQLVLAAVLAAYLDLLSDTKRTADALERSSPAKR
jgi:hypothetical protein